MSLPTHVSSRPVQSQDCRNATLISAPCTLAIALFRTLPTTCTISPQVWHSEAVQWHMVPAPKWPLKWEQGSSEWPLGVRLLESSLVVFIFERVNSIESLERSVAKGLYNSCSTKHLMEARTLEALAGNLSVSQGLLSILSLSLSPSGLASRRLTETPSTTDSYGIRRRSPTELFEKYDCTRETQIICYCDQYNVQKSVYQVTGCRRHLWPCHYFKETLQFYPGQKKSRGSDKTLEPHAELSMPLDSEFFFLRTNELSFAGSFLKS